MNTFFVTFSALVAVGSGVAVESRHMRREQPEALAMSAHGDLLDMRTDPDDPEIPCNDEYPLGIPKTSDCVEPHHDLIVDPQMCAQAASMTNAGIDQLHYTLTEEWWESHPRGCFAWPCPMASSKMCYFFNPVGDDPCNHTGLGNHTGGGEHCQGTPVCFASHYQNGTVDANGGCPNHYAPVMSEKKCEAAASCLGFCAGAQFRIGVNNASQHHEFPQGCFINDWDGCFYFNPASDTMGMPQRPKGTPVCNATEPGHYWPNQATAASTPSH